MDYRFIAICRKTFRDFVLSPVILLTRVCGNPLKYPAATTRVLDRAMAAAGKLEEAVPVFSNQQSVDKAGVLFALPAILAQGLLKCKEVYQELSKGYYGLQSTILTLAFMALCRSKNPTGMCVFITDTKPTCPKNRYRAKTYV